MKCFSRVARDHHWEPGIRSGHFKPSHCAQGDCGSGAKLATPDQSNQRCDSFPFIALSQYLNRLQKTEACLFLQGLLSSWGPARHCVRRPRSHRSRNPGLEAPVVDSGLPQPLGSCLRGVGWCEHRVGKSKRRLEIQDSWAAIISLSKVFEEEMGRSELLK